MNISPPRYVPPEAYGLLPQLAELSKSTLPSSSDAELAQFAPPGSSRHRIPAHDIEKVLSLTPFFTPHQISQRLRMAKSTVYHIQEKPSAASSSPASSSRPGARQKLSKHQESALRAWIMKMRGYGAEITRSIVRMKALQMYGDVEGFRASVSWYRAFLKRNDLHELEVTSSHSSTTGLIPSSSSSSPHTLQEDAESQKEQYIDFASEFFVRQGALDVDGSCVLALDDMRTSHMHAKRVVDERTTSKAKVLSLGFEYATVNCTITIHGNGQFGIPTLMFKNTKQAAVDVDPSLLSPSSRSSSSSSSLSPAISLAEDAPANLPVLTCFTPTVHTTSQSYAAILKTAVRADLPQGGILVHDSDGPHLTSLAASTLQQQQISPVVTPRRLTRCGNPGDRVWNALVRQSMQSQQVFFLLSELEQNNGVIPPISASRYRSLMLGWFRNAFYSLSLRARQVAFWKAGLMLPDDGSQDAAVDVVIASGVRVTASDIRARVQQKRAALLHMDRITSSSSSSSSSLSSSSSSAPASSASSSSRAPELSHEAILRLQSALSTEMSACLSSARGRKSTARRKRVKRPSSSSSPSRRKRCSKPANMSRVEPSSSAFSSASSSSSSSSSSTSLSQPSRSSVSSSTSSLSSSSSSSTSSASAAASTSSSSRATPPPLRRSSRQRNLSDAGLLGLAVDFTFEGEPEWEEDGDEEAEEEQEEDE